jgi:hypothetical protein
MSDSLPPGFPVEPYVVDEYLGCPTNWMHGSDISSSYFLEVVAGSGMWLNFNNCYNHTHEVAIVISIQGINPITGQKMIGKNRLRLEKYNKKCPIHNVDFEQDRFCPKCGYKWPSQNYIATTGTPQGFLWIDGFRNKDGSVRQYIFTEEELKGVASQKIGKERVFAIGIAFYLSKEKKQKYLGSIDRREDLLPSYPTSIFEYWGTETNTPHCYWASSSDSGYSNYSKDFEIRDNKYLNKKSGFRAVQAYSFSEVLNNNNIVPNKFYNKTISKKQEKVIKLKPIKPVKKLEIGAGSLIKQIVYIDPKEIDFWEEKPAGMIYINYSDKESIRNIIEMGKREESKEGFLKGIELAN